MSPREPLRVTIAGRSVDVRPEQGASADIEATHPGAGVLVTAAGRRRILWSVLPPAAGHLGSGVHPVEVVVDGWRFEATVEPAARAALRDRARREAAIARAHVPLAIRAAIPGRIGVVRVIDGQDVEEGETLLTLEAMKMENVVRAPRTGTIVRVAVAAGQTVELGDTLLELE